MANRKNEFYWKNYIAAADVACRAAGYLLECMKGFDIGKIGAMLTAMHEFEHEGDSLRHEMTEALAKSFVTPFEREDMQELCQKLDRVIDNIEEVLQAIYFNCIGKISAESIVFAEKICICTAKMKEMLVELPNFKRYEKLRSLIIDVNTAEEECDALYLQANYDCRKNWNGKDPLEVIAWRDVYLKLEDCADACEHVADTVEAIVMKNS